MTDDSFALNIAELEAQHIYLVDSLSCHSAPAERLAILERLNGIRNKLHSVTEERLTTIRTEREESRRSRAQ